MQKAMYSQNDVHRGAFLFFENMRNIVDGFIKPICRGGQGLSVFLPWLAPTSQGIAQAYFIDRTICHDRE